MRRLNAARLRDEQGGVAVIVAVIMVALLAATALAIDVGAMYAERAQLQNGADAAALAVAGDCADGTCGNASSIAQRYADANANDGASAVSSVDFPRAGTVSVTTATEDAATGAGPLALTFAPLLGIADPDLSASATASWGSPASGRADLPLAFAPCVFRLDGAIQVLSIHGDSAAHRARARARLANCFPEDSVGSLTRQTRAAQMSASPRTRRWRVTLE